jgi:ATP-dependent Clp protease ATP-binding subunit ClpC
VREAMGEVSELSSLRDAEVYSDNMEEAKIISEYINDAKVNLSKEIEKAKRNKKNYCVTDYDICQLIAERTGIPVTKIKSSESESVSKIDQFLKEKIVGQDEAIDTVARAIKRSRVGLSNPDRPILSCMCIGNTGCGKTLLAKTLALEMFGDEKSLIRFDMSEYADSTSVNKLIGSSAGYVGYKEGGLLTEAVKKRKYSVLLIDEIEKANEEVFNLFLQILDEGMLTDNTGYKVDFRNTIIILTSNVGAKRAANEKTIGFDADNADNKRSIIEKELKNKFPPEFINRIDEIVYFNQLTDENLRKIVVLEIEKLKKRLSELKYGFNYDDSVVDFIYGIAVKDKEFGARPIARAVRNEIEYRITDEILKAEHGRKEFTAHVADSAIFIE